MLGGISQQSTSMGLNAWRHLRAEHVGEHVALQTRRASRVDLHGSGDDAAEISPVAITMKISAVAMTRP
jgi:hypothetical protein